MVRYEGGVVGVADYDAGYAFRAGVCVEGVGFRQLLSMAVMDSREQVEGGTFLFNILSLAWPGPLRYCLAEKGHELAIARGSSTGISTRAVGVLVTGKS